MEPWTFAGALQGASELLTEYSDPWALVAALVWAVRHALPQILGHLERVESTLEKMDRGVDKLVREQKNRQHDQRTEDVAKAVAELLKNDPPSEADDAGVSRVPEG